MFPALCLPIARQEAQQKMSLRPRFEAAAPLPGLPSIMIDSVMDGAGIAQPLARSRNLQARILWIDATANIVRYNTEEKVQALVHQIKSVGFNTIVFDVKPLSGQVVYKSKFAPKLVEWRGQTLPEEFDPLASMCRAAKAADLSIMASLNAFCEGHRLLKVGPGYAQPEHQSHIYEPKPVLVASDHRFPLGEKMDVLSPDVVDVLSRPPLDRDPTTGIARNLELTKDAFAVAIGSDRRVIRRFNPELDKSGPATGEHKPATLVVPSGGYLLYGRGAAADFLKANLSEGTVVRFDTDASYVPMADSASQQYALMMNPNDPVVRTYELSIAREVVSNYPVDGIVYDDRLRYAGIDGDFSEITRQKFESVVGKKLTWPDDVFKFTLNANFTHGIKPGPFYDQWMAWRASVLRDYLVDVRKTIQLARPGVRLGMYVGSWYGEYPALGNNYADANTNAGFWFLSPNYRRTGDASVVDFVIPGCYYSDATIQEALEKGDGIGSTVEAGGRMVNRLVRDQAWTYAGLSLIAFSGNPKGLANALQAACASTEGVMVFDLSHNIDPMWPVFARAFAQPAKPPHMTAFLTEVRHRRASLDKMGVIDPPLFIPSGSAGVGQ